MDETDKQTNSLPFQVFGLATVPLTIPLTAKHWFMTAYTISDFCIFLRFYTNLTLNPSYPTSRPTKLPAGPQTPLADHQNPEADLGSLWQVLRFLW